MSFERKSLWTAIAENFRLIKMFPIEIREQPATRLAAIEHVGPYEGIESAFDKVCEIATSRNLWPQSKGMMAVFYDDPDETPVDMLRSHAGIVLPDDVQIPNDMQKVSIEQGRVAVLTYKGPYTLLKNAYEYFFSTWLPQSQEKRRQDPPFEIYLNSPQDTPVDELLTEICLPLCWTLSFDRALVLVHMF